MFVGVCLVIFGLGFALVGRYQRWSFKEAPNEVEPEGMSRLMRRSAEWNIRLGLAVAALGAVVLAIAAIA